MSSGVQDPPHLVDDYFRHEYGRLVAILLRRVGPQHIEAVEDAVQTALMRALETWPRAEVPQNPSAWLYRVARNALMGSLRSHTLHTRLHQTLNSDDDRMLPNPSVTLANEFNDDLLKMLFVCCDDAIPVESQLIFALKTLCGFSVKEIAQRLFASEASVYKRLGRALSRLRSLSSKSFELSPAKEAARLPAVQKILYTLFTEGHLSSHADFVIRRELCHEALRLTSLLAAHKSGKTPTTFALLALIHLHIARMSARQNGEGGLLLLEEQDRTLYNAEHIHEGLRWLERASEGAIFSRYHAEAGIAAEHCLAKTFAETRWENVIACYALLNEVAPTAIHRLNHAVAVAELEGPLAALTLVQNLEPPTWLTGSYLWSAVLADLHARCKNESAAYRYRSIALELAPTPVVRALLERRLSRERF